MNPDEIGLVPYSTIDVTMMSVVKKRISGQRRYVVCGTYLLFYEYDTRPIYLPLSTAGV